MIIGVYAPDQGKGAVTYRRFLQDLKIWIAAIMSGRRTRSPYYLMGDFNAVLDNHRDSYNQVRAPNIYNQDTSFQNFVRELNLQDPIHLRGDAEGARFSWTFRTNVRTENDLDYTHRRIDYILASSARGTQSLIIDPDFLFPHSGIGEDYYNDTYIQSDHRPVIMKINLVELEAYLPDFVLPIRRAVTKYPDTDDKVGLQKLQDHIKNLGTNGRNDISRRFHPRNSIPTMMRDPQFAWAGKSPDEINTSVKDLHYLLAEELPGPFKKIPGEFGARLSKDQKNTMKQMSRTKRQVTAVLIALQYYSESSQPELHTSSWTHPRDTIYYLSRARIKRKVRGLTLPIFAMSYFDQGNPDYIRWRTEAAAKKRI